MKRFLARFFRLFAPQPLPLDAYWPLDAPQRRWTLADCADKSKHMMTVANARADSDAFRLWFSGKPGQNDSDVNIEEFRHDARTGGWLWLDKYIDHNRDSGAWIEHSIQSEKIRFTPPGGAARDLIAEGTYARAGGFGQPYLLLDGARGRYRIQVWGTIGRDQYPDSNWQWYWDATVYPAEAIYNGHMKWRKPAQAIKVKEAWWDNFAGPGQWTGAGSGAIGEDGRPTGERVVPFRTVWHADGQIPYYMTGTAAEAPDWCMVTRT